MRDLLPDLLSRWRAGRPVALAVVTATWASAPRPVGAAMFVDTDGTAVGSVSGGCVEGDVYERCREVLASGVPQTVRYGVSDDDAFAVGLPCGGSIEVFVSRVDPASFPALPQLADALGTGTPVALLTCVAGPPEQLGEHVVLTATAPSPTTLDDAVLAAGRDLLAAGRTGLLHPSADVSVLVTSFLPAARMIVAGATDHAAAVARIGAFLGYRVTVCDARAVFATTVRFPDAHDVVVDRPDRYLTAEAAAGRLDGRTVVCVLTHDPRFDLPALEVALALPVAYVGAMGSRRTHDERRDRLREAGLSPGALARLASPIGLDLGARTPEETAVSIAAEIVALHRGGTGARLADRSGPIHPGPAVSPGA
jgi:xanthine dehydrogenase accessory factor